MLDGAHSLVLTGEPRDGAGAYSLAPTGEPRDAAGARSLRGLVRFQPLDDLRWVRRHPPLGA